MKLKTIVLLLCAIICMASCSKNRSENSEISDEEEVRCLVCGTWRFKPGSLTVVPVLWPKTLVLSKAELFQKPVGPPTYPTLVQVLGSPGLPAVVYSCTTPWTKGEIPVL